MAHCLINYILRYLFINEWDRTIHLGQPANRTRSLTRVLRETKWIPLEEWVVQSTTQICNQTCSLVIRLRSKPCKLVMLPCRQASRSKTRLNLWISSPSPNRFCQELLQGRFRGMCRISSLCLVSLSNSIRPRLFPKMWQCKTRALVSNLIRMFQLIIT